MKENQVIEALKAGGFEVTVDHSEMLITASDGDHKVCLSRETVDDEAVDTIVRQVKREVAKKKNS